MPVPIDPQRQLTVNLPLNVDDMLRTLIFHQGQGNTSISPDYTNVRLTVPSGSGGFIAFRLASTVYAQVHEIQIRSSFHSTDIEVSYGMDGVFYGDEIPMTEDIVTTPLMFPITFRELGFELDNSSGSTVNLDIRIKSTQFDRAFYDERIAPLLEQNRFALDELAKASLAGGVSR